MKDRIPFADCRNEDAVNNIFGSISEFARLCEEFGDSFSYRGVDVVYDEEKDIHYFY